MKGCFQGRTALGSVAAVTAILLVPLLTVAPAGADDALVEGMKQAVHLGYGEPRDREDVLRAAGDAVRGGVPPETLLAVIEKSMDEGVSGPGLAGMLRVLAEAGGRGIPTTPLTSKIMEGLAKDVGEENIIRAMGKVEERLEFAVGQADRVPVRPAEREELIINTADAVAAGVDRRAIERVFEAMAGKGPAGRVAPSQVMEAVKTGGGYGVDSDTLGRYAADLARDRKADRQDVERFVREISDRSRRGESVEDLRRFVEDSSGGRSGGTDEDLQDDDDEGEGDEEESETGSDGGEETPDDDSGEEDPEGDPEGDGGAGDEGSGHDSGSEESGD